jgi:hypothetical protein
VGDFARSLFGSAFVASSVKPARNRSHFRFILDSREVRPKRLAARPFAGAIGQALRGVLASRLRRRRSRAWSSQSHVSDLSADPQTEHLPS